jgi:hypothetical protein
VVSMSCVCEEPMVDERDGICSTCP